jgi:hypothetical protein
MNSTEQQQINELRDNLVGLTEACPLEECNADDCPLRSVREMNPRERLHWINSLSLDDLIFLAAYHEVCLGTNLEMRLIQCC